MENGESKVAVCLECCEEMCTHTLLSRPRYMEKKMQCAQVRMEHIQTAEISSSQVLLCVSPSKEGSLSIT